MHFSIEGVRNVYACYVDDLEGIDIILALKWVNAVGAVMNVGLITATLGRQQVIAVSNKNMFWNGASECSESYHSGGKAYNKGEMHC